MARYRDYRNALSRFDRDWNATVTCYFGDSAHDYDLDAIRSELYWACIDQDRDNMWVYTEPTVSLIVDLAKANRRCGAPVMPEMQSISDVFVDFVDYMDTCGMGELYRSMIGR